jgi:hypothetical protein
MTLKYTLTIEGTERELSLIKQHTYWPHVDLCRADCHVPTERVNCTFEYKVVEPLRFEFTHDISERGRLNIENLVCGLQHAGKKVKVVITEEE